MPTLTNTERRIATKQWIMKAFVELGETATLSNADINAALNAADDWSEANAASFNAALPQPFRSVATPEQKAMLLAALCMRRAGWWPFPVVEP